MVGLCIGVWGCVSGCGVAFCTHLLGKSVDLLPSNFGRACRFTGRKVSRESLSDGDIRSPVCTRSDILCFSGWKLFGSKLIAHFRPYIHILPIKQDIGIDHSLT